MIRPAALAALGLAAAGCATPPDPSREHRPAGIAVPLANAGFESESIAGRECPHKWDCVVHATAHSFRFSLDETTAASGRRSLRIERVTDEPWAMATQTVWTGPKTRGVRMRFSLAIRSLSQGGPGVGAIVAAQNGSGAQVGLWKSYVPSSGEWKRALVEFDVPASAALIEVGVVVDGSGPAWIDDAHLEILQAEAKKPV